jgi:hypothetical protein
MPDAFRVAFAALIGLILLAPAPVQAFDLDELAGSLRLTERHEIGFREERSMAALTSSIVSTGYFVFEPPGRLVKMMETPRRERAIVENDRLTVSDDEGTEIASVDLASQPALKQLFGGLLALLSGNAETLRAVFDVSLSGGADDWRLDLTPRERSGEGGPAGLDRLIVTGGGGAMKTIGIREADGDRTRVTLHRKAQPK